MKEPTKEQIKKFWEKCGLHYTVPYWLDKNDALAFYGEVYSELLRNLDLNNLFKYAVPKVYDMELLKLNRFEGEWQTAYRARVRLAQQPWLPEVRDKDPALALFWAIYGVFK